MFPKQLLGVCLFGVFQNIFGYFCNYTFLPFLPLDINLIKSSVLWEKWMKYKCKIYSPGENIADPAAAGRIPNQAITNNPWKSAQTTKKSITIWAVTERKQQTKKDKYSYSPCKTWQKQRQSVALQIKNWLLKFYQLKQTFCFSLSLFIFYSIIRFYSLCVTKECWN